MGRSGGIGRPRRVSRTRGVGHSRRIPGSRRVAGFLRMSSPSRVGTPGGVRHSGRVGRSGGVGGPRRVSRPRRRSRPSSLRQVLTAPAAWPVWLAGPGTRASAVGPRAAGGRRIAGIPWHVEQAARRVDGRGVQHLLPARACGGAASLLTMPVPVPVGRPGSLLTGRATRRGPASREHENHQDDQAERHARRGDAQADSGDMAHRMAGEEPYCRAHDHKQDAEHDRDGARDRQGYDKPYPPVGGGVRAHCSTIASRLLARKPYEQVRWL